MSTKLKFRCPDCRARLSVKDRVGGRRLDCPNCANPITVPTTTDLVPYQPRPLVVPEVADGSEFPPVPARRRRRRESSVPVEMRLPGQLGGMRAEVDRKTSNMMATTFLGGVLLALGAVLMALFGGRGKSA